MKNSLLKWYMLAFMLVSNFVVFAQPAGDTTEPESSDPAPVTPISGKLILLLIAGIAFAYVYYAKMQKEKKAI